MSDNKTLKTYKAPASECKRIVRMRSGMGSHQSHKMKNDEWLTPPWILERLGEFDLDPCAPSPEHRPWDTAKVHYSEWDDGLSMPWVGRVWLNPPYGKYTARWLHRLYKHGDGIALTFARTETDMFFRAVWGKADGVLFIKGRLHFYDINGIEAKSNSGAPSVLIAYGKENVEILKNSKIPGAYVVQAV